MKPVALDDHDRRILALLRGNGRLSNQDLADRIGLSTSQCSRRRIALEQSGMILGYYAQISPLADSTPMVGMVEVRMVSHAPQAVAALMAFIEREAAIRDVFKITGDYDYLLKIAAADLPDMSRLISELASLSASVSHVRTAVVLERVKENGHLPVLSTPSASSDPSLGATP